MQECGREGYYQVKKLPACTCTTWRRMTSNSYIATLDCRKKTLWKDMSRYECFHQSYIINIFYRDFKKDCPTGILEKKRILELYEQILPGGQANAKFFTDQIFRLFDDDRNGVIDFRVFRNLWKIFQQFNCLRSFWSQRTWQLGEPRRRNWSGHSRCMIGMSRVRNQLK